MKPENIQWYVDQKYKGIVLEGTGLGHVGTYLLNVLENAIQKVFSLP